MRDHTQRENIEKSLEYLQTDYLDLLLIHWPVAGVYKESWKIMEEFYKEGKIRAIGVSNFQIHHLDDLLRTAGGGSGGKPDRMPSLSHPEAAFCITVTKRALP